MGSAVGSVCYATSAEAADVTFSAVPPRINDGGYTLYEKSGQAWQLNTYQTGSGAPVLSASIAVQPVQVDCSNLDRVQDGISLGWFTMTPALVVFALLYLKRVLP